jgi:hypothetical protein
MNSLEHSDKLSTFFITLEGVDIPEAFEKLLRNMKYNKNQNIRITFVDKLTPI